MPDYLKALSYAVLIEPEAAEAVKNFKTDEFEKVFNKIKEQKPLVLTKSVLDKFLVEPIRIIKKMNPRPVHGIQDLTNSLNSRYRGLQEIILSSHDLKDTISIGNCRSGHATIIGLVMSKKQEGENWVLEMEDPTGTIKAVLPSNLGGKKIELDCVFALSGAAGNGAILAEEIVWPDVPDHKPTTARKSFKALFIANHDFKTRPQAIETADYIILYNCTGWESLPTELPNCQIAALAPSDCPCLLDVAGLVVLVHFDQEQPADVLRKRFISVNGLDFVLEPAPDIFFTAVAEPADYNGVRIIGGAMLDTASREAGVPVPA